MRKALFSLFLALFTLVMFALPPGNHIIAASGTLETMLITENHSVSTESAPTMVIAVTADIIENSGSPPVSTIALTSNNSTNLLIASELAYMPLKFPLTNTVEIVCVVEAAAVSSQYSQSVVMFNMNKKPSHSKPCNPWKECGDLFAFK